MTWVDITVIILLCLSFIGGVKEGMIKNIFSLIGLLIAIPIAGALYHLLAVLLFFLPGKEWENFIAFYIVLGLTTAIVHLFFLIPRKLMEKGLGAGGPFRLVGGLLNVFSSAIGFAVFVVVLRTYPIFDWMVTVVNDSSVLAGIAMSLGFVQGLLPEALRQAASSTAFWPIPVGL